MATMSPWARVHPAAHHTSPNIDYNEDDIANLITSIYCILIRLGPLEDASVAWPPSEGHQVDLSHIPAHVSTDRRVISLMKRLPIDVTGSTLIPNMRANNFLCPTEVRVARMVDMRNYDLNLMGGDEAIFGPPTTLTLFRGNNEFAPLLVLDVSDNTIRLIVDMEELVDDYTKKEKDLQKLHEYRYNFYNWPAMPAPIYLQSVIRNFLDAKWIPDPYGIIHVPDEEGETEVIEQRRLLKEEYGWPDSFREEAWKQEVQKVPEIDLEEEML